MFRFFGEVVEDGRSLTDPHYPPWQFSAKLRDTPNTWTQLFPLASPVQAVDLEQDSRGSHAGPDKP